MMLTYRRRCRARMEPQTDQPYHGRCDLRASHDGPHVLERGMDEIRWTTEPLRTASSSQTGQ